MEVEAEAAALGLHHGGTDLGGDVQGSPHGQRPALLDDGLQAGPLHVLADDVGTRPTLADVEDANDVGLRQTGGGLRLAPKSLLETGVGGIRLPQHLDDHRTIEEGIAAFVDHGQAPLVQEAQDLVAIIQERRLAHHTSPTQSVAP